MRPGNLPLVEQLSPLPVASMAGCCLAVDSVGVGGSLYTASASMGTRFVYALFPTVTGPGAGVAQAATTFWRYDFSTNTWQQLATPAVGVTDVYGVGTALLVDTSQQRIWMFNAQNAGNWARWAYYNPNTDTWTQRNTATLGLAAQWGTDVALAHTCTSIGIGGNDDFMYLVGNGVVGAYRYGIAGDAWVALAGGGGARPAAPGAGCSLDWIPTNPGVLYSFRGGATANVDVYTLATDAWLGAPGLNYMPNTTTFTAGAETCIDPKSASIWVHQAGRVFSLSPTAAGAGYMAPYGTLYVGDGTPHVGRGIVSGLIGAQKFMLIRKHTSTEFQRVWIIE